MQHQASWDFFGGRPIEQTANKNKRLNIDLKQTGKRAYFGLFHA